MNTFKTLMQREWMQHRLGWMLLAGIPLALAALGLGFGEIQIGQEAQAPGAPLPTLVALVTMLASTLILFAIMALTSLFLVSGLPRRDHADRSNEFWLSLPTGHASSLAAPMAMHLLVVPAAALVIGLAGGWLLSLLVVSRVASMGDWFALPWAQLVPAVLAGLARLLAGLPLAVLWLSPLLLLVMLSTALLRRWGLVALAVGLPIAHGILSQAYGIGVVGDTLALLTDQARRALFISGPLGESLTSGGGDGESIGQVLAAVPGWMASDLGTALAALATPAMLGVLLASAAGFALLVQWRRRSV